MAFMKLKDAQGRMMFDSTLAAGGVALGFFTVPGGGGSFSFPDFVGRSGVALCAGRGVNALLYTVDNNLGYLRFNFEPLTGGMKVVLFAI